MLNTILFVADFTTYSVYFVLSVAWTMFKFYLNKTKSLFKRKNKKCLQLKL